MGITLTAANRVVILDPSWNPATDAQAVDRAYRIGQKSNVLVYRLITCGTVEEKIYRRQIFKESVIRQTTNSGRNKTDHDPYRYFTRQDLRELFTLTDARVSTTQEQLSQLHEAIDKWEDPWLQPHLNYLTGGEMSDFVFGLSFHDLMFTRPDVCDPVHPTVADEAMHEQEILRNRMVAAEYAIARECAGVNAPRLVHGGTTGLSEVPIHGPPDGFILAPSAADSRRPMLNRPHLGVLAHYPNVQQCTPPWMTQPVVKPSQADEIIDLTDRLATSFCEMSISQAGAPSRVSDRSLTNSNRSPSCVILDGQENLAVESPVDNQYGSSRISGTEHKPKPDNFLVSNLHGLSVTEPPPGLCSSVHSACRSTSKASSGRSLSMTDSPLPSSKAFLGSVRGDLYRSTPVPLKTAPHPLVPETSLRGLEKSNELPPTSNSSVPNEGTNDRQNPLISSERSSIGLSASPKNAGGSLLMDITADFDDEQFHQTVNMKSMHEVSPPNF